MDNDDSGDEETRRLWANYYLKEYVDTYFYNDNVIILGDFNDELTDQSLNNVFQDFIDDSDKINFCQTICCINEDCGHFEVSNSGNIQGCYFTHRDDYIDATFSGEGSLDIDAYVKDLDCAGICGGDASLCCEDGSLKKSYNSNIITVLDSSRCFNKSDLAVLQEFINLNKSLNGKEPLGIGKQSWMNRRLIYLYLDKQSITTLPSNLDDLKKVEVLF